MNFNMEENIEKYEKIFYNLEKKYSTYKVLLKFLKTERSDFDSNVSNKVVIKQKEMKLLLDVLYLSTRSKIQYWSQFSLRLTYNHIWSYYDEIVPQVYSALEAISY